MTTDNTDHIADLLGNALKTMDDGVDRILFLLNMDNQWGEHPDWPRADWSHEAGDNDTNLGYWHWVAARLVDDDDEGDDNDD